MTTAEKLREAAAMRKELSRWDELTRIGGEMYHFGAIDLSEKTIAPLHST